MQCEFWSRQRNRLDNHVQRVHLKQKNFLCDKCEFRAFIQPELDAHIREVSNFWHFWTYFDHFEAYFDIVSRLVKLDRKKSSNSCRKKNFLCDKCKFMAFIQPQLDAHIWDVGGKAILESFLFCMYLGFFTLPL